MNKQEAIDELENAIPDFILTDYQKGKESGLSYALELVEQLDEPKKPVIPQYVAEWLEVCKDNLALSLANSMNPIVMRTNNQPEKTIHWFGSAKNQEIFAKAWFYGYEAEKEKSYRMRHKLTGEYLCFTLNKSFHSDDLNWYTEIKRTQKEWEDMGYWDNNLYESEEVLND